MAQVTVTWVPAARAETPAHDAVNNGIRSTVTSRGLMLVATDTLGHSFVLDAKTDAGGSDSGFRPIDLQMVALGACAAMDIVSILEKKRAELRWFRVEVEGERADEYPKRLTRMKVRFIANKEVKIEDLQRSMELSRDKYCSVAGTLRIPPQIEYEVGTE